MAITIEKEIYLNVAEAGALIDRSKNTIYNRYKKWDWKAYKYDGAIMFKQKELEQWLKDRVKLK